MKALFLVLTGLLVVWMPVAGQKAVSFQPEKPQAGETITITYNPSGTSLQGASDPEAIAYLLEGGLPRAVAVLLIAKGPVYQGNITTTDSTLALFVSFSKDETRDNNNEEGYYSYLYSKEGQPLPGARLFAGLVFNSTGSIWGLKKDSRRGSDLIQEDLTDNPLLKEKHIYDYLNLLAQSKEESDKALIKAELEKILARPDAKESDLSGARYYYESVLKDNDKALTVAELMKSRFPEGRWKRMESYAAFNAEKDLAKKEAMYRKLLADSPPRTAFDEDFFSSLASQLVRDYGMAGKFDKMREYGAQVKNKGTLASVYNAIAWKLAGEGIHGIPGDAKTGKEISGESLRLMEEQLNDLNGKPPFYTDEQYRKQLEKNYHGYADTYALLLYRLKDYKNALAYQKRAVEASGRNSTGLNEVYAIYVEKVNGPSAARKELESFIKDGRYNPGMKEQLKRIYLAQQNSENQWNTYIAGLEKASLEKKRADLLKTMISETAPDFALKNLDGTEVSLAALKGKIVVIDFWATWCGPCKASFPGMKLAVEKYRNDPEVAFVFIDSWEKGEKKDVKENVAAFIEQNAYPFQVLMDYDNTVIASYKVDGIPTRFVIDANSKIRFRSIGFSGSDSVLADEMTMMIEMVRNSGTSESKKGF